MRSLLRQFLRNERGAAAAEMALILPAALAVMFATFEGAHYMMTEQRVIKGVREAARYAGRLDFSLYGCPGGTFSGSTATIQNLARTGQLVGGVPRVSSWENNDTTVTVTCTAATTGIYKVNGNFAPAVRVSARVSYPSLMGAMGFSDVEVFLAASAESPVTGL